MLSCDNNSDLSPCAAEVIVRHVAIYFQQYSLAVMLTPKAQYACIESAAISVPENSGVVDDSHS